MKKLFTAIQKNDHASVTALLSKDPELIHCVHQGNPKKYDGQSPLQVALKTSDSKMIEFLLVYHPDVNFMEDESCANDWRTPVIHDAINRAVMSVRWNVSRPDGLEVFNTQTEADEAFAILQRLVELGADVNAKDSYGNACMDRACLQARQILPRPNSDDRLLTEELRDDLNRIFTLLRQNGADMRYIAPGAFGKTYAEQYNGEVVGVFLGLCLKEVSMMNEHISARSAAARQNFLKGYGCAQSVLLAYADLTGLDEKTLAKLGSSFGGGMGRLREVCGGVTGAFAVLGLLCGYDDPGDTAGKSRHYADIRELARRFTERSRGGSIVCREILKNAGLSGDKGGEAEARTAEYYEKRPCPDLVALAAEVLGEMLVEKGILK